MSHCPICLANISEVPAWFFLAYFCVMPCRLFFWDPYTLFNIFPMFGDGIVAALFQGIALVTFFGVTPVVFRSAKLPRFFRYGYLPLGYPAGVFLTNLRPVPFGMLFYHPPS